jgi:CheY-like chemotaxis protein
MAVSGNDSESCLQSWLKAIQSGTTLLRIAKIACSGAVALPPLRGCDQCFAARVLVKLWLYRKQSVNGFTGIVGPPGGLMKRRIVIADDDPMIVSLVGLRLEIAGYEILAAGNAENVLALIRKSHALAVILNIDMPGGMDLLDAIKSEPAGGKLPVMLLTGGRDTGMVMRAMGSGAADYLVKPFHPDRLLARIDRLVPSGTAQWAEALHREF